MDLSRDEIETEGREKFLAKPLDSKGGFHPSFLTTREVAFLVLCVDSFAFAKARIENIFLFPFRGLEGFGG